MRALFRSLFFTLIYMLALVAAVIPLVLLGLRLPLLIAAALIWLIGSAIAVHYAGEAIDGWGIICAAVPVMLTAYALPDYLALNGTVTVNGVSVDAIARYPEARAFEFVDARVQTDYAATYVSTSRSRSGGTTRLYYHVAPLTTRQWQPNQPIVAWVGCTASYGATCPEWQEPYRVGVRASEWNQDGLRQAVDSAVSEHQLTTTAESPIFTWTASVKAEAEQTGATLLGASIFAYLLWAIPKIVVTIVRGMQKT